MVPNAPPNGMAGQDSNGHAAVLGQVKAISRLFLSNKLAFILAFVCYPHVEAAALLPGAETSIRLAR